MVRISYISPVSRFKSEARHLIGSGIEEGWGWGHIKLGILSNDQGFDNEKCS